MSFVRASEKMRYSNYDEPLYVFTCDVDRIEDYGDLNNREAFCEVMFRVLDQSGVDVDLEMVNKARDRLGLEPIESIGQGYETREEFEDMMEDLEEELEDD